MRFWWKHALCGSSDNYDTHHTTWEHNNFKFDILFKISVLLQNIWVFTLNFKRLKPSTVQIISHIVNQTYILLRHHMKIILLLKLMIYQFMGGMSALTAECRTFLSGFSCRTEAQGSGKDGRFLTYLLGNKPCPIPSLACLSPSFTWCL